MPEYIEKAILLEPNGVPMRAIYSIADERVKLKSLLVGTTNIAAVVKLEIIEEITAYLEHKFTAPSA